MSGMMKYPLPNKPTILTLAEKMRESCSCSHCESCAASLEVAIARDLWPLVEALRFVQKHDGTDNSNCTCNVCEKVRESLKPFAGMEPPKEAPDDAR